MFIHGELTICYKTKSGEIKGKRVPFSFDNNKVEEDMQIMRFLQAVRTAVASMPSETEGCTKEETDKFRDKFWIGYK